MDVSPWLSRLFLSAIIATLLASCGNRYDLSTDRGRRARIDDANFHLSKSQCTAALESIDPLYHSPHVDDEVRVIKASAHACVGTFNMLNLMANLAEGGNAFAGIARSLSNAAGDGRIRDFYRAVDVLTRSNTLLDASQRSLAVNNYMVFLQMGVVGSILRNYGSPATDGSQGAPLVYDTSGSPPGEMDDEDACALAAAFSSISDSYSRSSLGDSSTAAINNSLNAICVAALLPDCTALSRNRASCDGTNPASEDAERVVTGVNAAW
jgi:hypothetical protein